MFLHLHGLGLELVHRLDRIRRTTRGIARLLVDDPRRFARDPGEVQQQRGFQFSGHPVLDPQGIDDDAVAGVEFHEVEPAERGGVLILLAAGQAEVDALDVVGEVRDLVFAQRQRKILRERGHQRDHQGGRRTQAGTWRRIGPRTDAQRRTLAVEIVAADAQVGACEQLHRPGIRIHVAWRDSDACAAIQGFEDHERIAAGIDGRVGVLVDGRVHHATAVQVAVRGDIGAATGQPEAQRRARADDHRAGSAAMASADASWVRSVSREKCARA